MNNSLAFWPWLLIYLCTSIYQNMQETSDPAYLLLALDRRCPFIEATDSRTPTSV